MKIIDKTPLLDEKGQLGMLQRIQGMLQFGLNWPNELQAQKAIITYFDRQLEKGYTLIRNYTLGQSEIMVPIILIGPSGIHVIHIANMKGRYEVKGDQWNIADGDSYKPAPVNLVQGTMRMAAAVKRWIERQGTKVPVDIEPVLIAGEPGLHIQSVRPAVRVMMIDGIKSYVSGLATAQPVLTTETIYELTERIINPRPPRTASPAHAAPLPRTNEFNQPPQEDVSRARAIFNASQEAKPFDPADFDFAMDEEASMDVTPAPSSFEESSPEQSLSRSKPRSRRVLGMTPGQLGILGALALLFLCIVAGLAYYVFVLS